MEKLVRDKIPEIMLRHGVVARVRRAAKGERLAALLAKLQEEEKELKDNQCLEECADVLEVVIAIALELGFSRDALFEAAASKVRERGAFNEGILLTLEVKP